jgi:hypothetical protein
MATNTYMVADKRERFVIPTLSALLGPKLKECTINVGDYLICRNTVGSVEAEVLACIERKSLADFASSFADGRYENRGKMMELREKTGCLLFYLVEGPAFPSPTWNVGHGVKYQSILSAMTSLPLTCGIHIIQTKDVQHTAERLRDHLTILEKTLVPYKYPVTAPLEASTNTNLLPDVVPAALTGAYEKDPDTLAMEVWSRLPGISITTGKIMVGLTTVSDFLNGKGPAPAEIKTASNKKLVKKALASLTSLLAGNTATEVLLLSGVSGVSPKMATEILAGVPYGTNKLRGLCNMPAAELGMVMLTQKSRSVRLGETRAKMIHTIFQWKTGDEAPGAAAPGAAAPGAAAPGAAPLLPAPNTTAKNQGRLLGGVNHIDAQENALAGVRLPPPIDSVDEALLDDTLAELLGM